VLKANGYTPVWVTGNRLSAASGAALKAIDLHFHDLRHEGASRMLETGWPLHHIHHMLGHASLEQTSTYLNVEKTGLQDSMRRFGVPAGIRCNGVAMAAVSPLQEQGDAVTSPVANSW
jgi:integrase-like protein